MRDPERMMQAQFQSGITGTVKLHILSVVQAESAWATQESKIKSGSEESAVQLTPLSIEAQCTRDTKLSALQRATEKVARGATSTLNGWQ